MWTPQAVDQTLMIVAGIASTIYTIVKLLKSNSDLTNSTANSIPPEFAHKALDNAIANQTPSLTTTVNNITTGPTPTTAPEGTV